jgi:ABC-type dipeptide/oligopeptide/nickel transport system permease subunit
VATAGTLAAPFLGTGIGAIVGGISGCFAGYYGADLVDDHIDED